MQNIIDKFVKKFFCNKKKHRWEYVTWGNAIVRDGDKGAIMCEISTRFCKYCDVQEYFLKNGWEPARTLTTDDL